MLQWFRLFPLLRQVLYPLERLLMCLPRRAHSTFFPGKLSQMLQRHPRHQCLDMSPHLPHLHFPTPASLKRLRSRAPPSSSLALQASTAFWANWCMVNVRGGCVLRAILPSLLTTLCGACIPGRKSPRIRQMVTPVTPASTAMPGPQSKRPSTDSRELLS